jgi:hypothetical protein
MQKIDNRKAMVMIGGAVILLISIIITFITLNNFFVGIGLTVYMALFTYYSLTDLVSGGWVNFIRSSKHFWNNLKLHIDTGTSVSWFLALLIRIVFLIFAYFCWIFILIAAITEILMK